MQYSNVRTRHSRCHISTEFSVLEQLYSFDERNGALVYTTKNSKLKQCLIKNKKQNMKRRENYIQDRSKYVKIFFIKRKKKWSKNTVLTPADYEYGRQ